MTQEKKFCLNCRFLELRRADDASAYYWCTTKNICPGKSVLGRPACQHYRPWWQACDEEVPPVAAR